MESIWVDNEPKDIIIWAGPSKNHGLECPNFESIIQIQTRNWVINLNGMFSTSSEKIQQSLRKL